MNITQPRVGRSVATALFSALACLTPAGNVLAAASASFSLMGGSARTLAPEALADAQKTVTKGKWSDANTLTFGQKIVRLVAVTGPENDMLSYRIEGRRNPTLVIPRGATIKMLFVNTDDDMLHNVRFGSILKTYPNVMTPYVKSSVGTPDLAHKTKTSLHAEELTLHAPAAPGAYAYFCTVRGHAQGGMVGKVVVG